MLHSLKLLLRNLYLKNKLKKEKEHIFDNKRRLKYLCIKNKKSKHLLVIFSGFPQRGSRPSYNYITKLNDVKMNLLFILDDFGNDSRGSYYLGENKDFFIETAVNELIENIRLENGIEKSNVITAGSSKGGYASLFFAFKYGYGATISGAPQYFLGDYLALPGHINIMEYISGGDADNDRMFLNDILAKEINTSRHKPKVFVHVSKNEHHYDDHVVPLINKLEENGLSYKLDLANYEHHGEVGRYFPIFLKGTLKEIT